MADPPTNSAIEARRLMRRQTRAALATSLAGAPYASLVIVAFDLDATPLLMLSNLAQHTQNLAADPRLSLLFDDTAGHANPLAGPRLTVLGRAVPSEDQRQRARFVARHPSAAGYVDFHDFHLYAVTIERGHLVAGFGRIEWIDGGELCFATPAEALAAAADDIVAHMNADHAEALGLYANRLLGRAGEGWRMTGVDPEGIDLRRVGDTARLEFAEPAFTPEAARAILVALAQRARVSAGG
jgi:putative heme iron utilization protein